MPLRLSLCKPPPNSMQDPGQDNCWFKCSYSMVLEFIRSAPPFSNCSKRSLEHPVGNEIFTLSPTPLRTDPGGQQVIISQPQTLARTWTI